jgi:hypothetical protein
MDASNQNQPQIQQTVVVVGKQKSVGVAFLLAFLFGPLGLLYASVTGGIIMFLLGIVIGIITFGFGLIFIWIGSIIWAVIAASNANKNIGAGLNINTSFGTQPQKQQHAAPIQQDPTYRSEEAPKIVISNPPVQDSYSAPSFDLSEWLNNNKKPVLLGAAGVVAALIIIIAFKLVSSLDFSKKEKDQPTISYQENTTSPNIEQNATTIQDASNPYEREIPRPLVSLVQAANVLPTWTQSEDIEGNFPLLTGLYVGAIGKKPFKIVISNVDTVNKTISGYSETSTSQSQFEGKYTMTVREPNSRVADNVIDFQTWVFDAVLFEPSGINHSGVFQIRFNCTDANGRNAFGTWTSYDGRLYREIRLMDTYTAQEQ